MKRLIFAVILAVSLVLSVSVAAQYVGATGEVMTIADTAVGFTASTLADSSGLQVRVCRGRLETAQIRFYYNGTTPTALDGTMLEVGDWLVIPRHENLKQFKAIRTGAVSGVIRWQCEVAK